MASFASLLSWVRGTGLAGYTMAALACAVVWSTGRHRRQDGRPFGLLTIVQLALLVDMATNFRWLLHEFWMRQAQTHGLYAGRREPQLIAVSVLAAAVLACLLLVWSKFQERPGVAMALGSTTVSLGLWCTEALSYHGIDALLYHPVGPLLAINFLWLALALVTILGALIDSRSPHAG